MDLVVWLHSGWKKTDGRMRFAFCRLMRIVVVLLVFGWVVVVHCLLSVRAG